MSAHTLRGSQVVCMLLKLGEDQVILFKQRAHTLNTRQEIVFALIHSFFLWKKLGSGNEYSVSYRINPNIRACPYKRKLGKGVHNSNRKAYPSDRVKILFFLASVPNFRIHLFFIRNPFIRNRVSNFIIAKKLRAQILKTYETPNI